MLKSILYNFRCSNIKQRGQVLVFYALMIPIFLAAAGVGLDLGWYYLNVSRLQNAADAAVVAGASEFVNDDNDEAFKYVEDYAFINNRPFDESRKYNDTTSAEKHTIDKANEAAEDYAVKNLGSKKEVNTGTKKSPNNETWILSSWSKSKKDIDRKVDMNATLYDYGTAFYYVVDLKESIEHLFLPGWFSNIDAPVRAVVKLNNHQIDEALKEVKNENVVVGNWEVQNIYRQAGNKAEYKKRFGYDIYDGKWNMYQDSKNHYYVGDNHRTETINITPSNTGNSFATTSANGSKYYDETEVESLNIDFKPEVTFNLGSKWLEEDWDLAMGYDSSVSRVWNNSWDTSGKYKDADIKIMRVHSAINFNEAYKARANATEDPDILWVRIEGETMLHYPDSPNGEKSKKGEDMRSFNSVHQIIINANKSNYDTASQKYRPVVIFYDGPESNDEFYAEYRNRTDVLHRKSLPVILNLNAPFRGILYAPNSPVVVVGKDKDKFKGFVVAKSYLRLKDDDDFTLSNIRYYDTSKKNNEYFKFVDETGNVIFKDSKGNKVNKTENNLYKVNIYNAKDDSSETKTEYYKITENGIDMFIDEWGNVQYAELKADDPLLDGKCGTYDTFGRTDFTTHQYHINSTSATNLLLSGK